MTVPEQLKPTIEWQNIQVADFSEVRMYLNRLQSNKSSWSKNLKNIKIDYTEPEKWSEFFENYEPTLSYVLALRLAALDYGLEYLTNIIEATERGKTIDHKTGKLVIYVLKNNMDILFMKWTILNVKMTTLSFKNILFEFFRSMGLCISCMHKTTTSIRNNKHTKKFSKKMC